jgi:hypothetical protein
LIPRFLFGFLAVLLLLLLLTAGPLRQRRCRQQKTEPEGEQISRFHEALLFWRILPHRDAVPERATVIIITATGMRVAQR